LLKEFNMARCALQAACAVFVFALCSQAVPADVQADFQQLFGAEVRKVSSTADTRDDAALSASLLKSAEASSDSPELQVLLLEKAYEFGLKNPASLSAAIAAMRLLADKAPQRRAQCLEKVLTAAQQLFARERGPAKLKAGSDVIGVLMELGDQRAADRKSPEALSFYQRAMAVANAIRSDRTGEIQSKIREIQPRVRTDQRHDMLRARLDRDAQDAEARNELVILNVVEYDDLEQAKKLLNRDMDEVLRTYVPLAAVEVAQTPPVSCLELAEWYRHLDDDASLSGQMNMLTHARDYYTRYLEAAEADDPHRLLAHKGLGEVKEEIRKLEEKLAGPDGGFAALLKEIQIISQGHNAGDRVAIIHKGKTLIDASSGEDTTGVTMVAFRNGLPSRAVTFDACNRRSESDKLAQTIESLSPMTLVVLAVRHDGATSFTERAQAAIRSVGGKTGLYHQRQLSSYYLIGRKGMLPGQAVERISDGPLAYPPTAQAEEAPRPRRTDEADRQQMRERFDRLREWMRSRGRTSPRRGG